MDLNGNVFVALPPDRVAPALTDPEMLRRMLPGCPGLKPAGPGRWRAPMVEAVARLGPGQRLMDTARAAGARRWNATWGP